MKKTGQVIDSVTQRLRARIDLLGHFLYLAEQANAEVATRYLDAVDRTCALLVTQPQRSTPYEWGIEEAAWIAQCASEGRPRPP